MTPHARALAAACVLLTWAAACSSHSEEGNDTLGGIQRGRNTPDAGADAANVQDASKEAGAAGDPALRRPPRTGCTTALADADLATSFPGWQVFRYPGVDAAGGSLAPHYELTRCDDLISLGLDYSGAQARRGSEPSLGFGRTAPIRGDFSFSWVVEAITKPSEDEESFLGMLSIAADRDDAGILRAGLAVAMAHRTGSGEIVLRRSQLRPTGDQELAPISLGAPTLPFRVSWQVQAGGDPATLRARVAITDGTSERVKEIAEPMPSPQLDLTFGLNRINPGGRSRLTLSELTLP